MVVLGSHGDAAKVATVGDVQRILDEALSRQEGQLEAQRSILTEVLAEVRVMSRAGGVKRSSLGESAEHAPMNSGGKWSFAGGESPDLEDHAVCFRRKASLSSVGLHAGLREARFSMARALGFESDVPLEDDMLPGNPAPDALTGTPAPLSQRFTERSSSFISKMARANAQLGVAPLHRFLRSVWVENACGSIILLNAVLIGVHAHRRAQDPTTCERYWEDMFLGFNIFFIVELTVRMFTFKTEFLFGRDWRWNVFDTLIVFSGVMEELLQRVGGQSDCNVGQSNSAVSGIPALRVIRVMRIVRIVRAFRTMSIFRELRVMVVSTLGCLVPLAWASLLLCFIQWCFSVYFVHLTTDSISQALRHEGPSILEEKRYKDAQTYFGGVFASVYTLYMSITGGMNWNDAASTLYEVTGQQHAVWLFILFIAITVFAVLNVITGVFVENATKIAFRDREILIQDTLQKREEYKQSALAVFHEADADGSGQVSYGEFITLLQDPRVQAFFENLELDVMGAHRMFRLLDLDGNGLVSAQEFVTGCMCLKGEAKTLDIAALLLEFHKLSRRLSRAMSRLEEDMALVASNIQGMTIEGV